MPRSSNLTEMQTNECVQGMRRGPTETVRLNLFLYFVLLNWAVLMFIGLVRGLGLCLLEVLTSVFLT